MKTSSQLRLLPRSHGSVEVVTLLKLKVIHFQLPWDELLLWEPKGPKALLRDY